MHPTDAQAEMEWGNAWSALGIESLRAGLNVPKKVRQADQPDAADLPQALEAVGPHGRPITVGRVGEDQLVESSAT